jgi:hypothetical protein
MFKEESYFRGIQGPASTTLVEPSISQAGDTNKGGLLTLNSQLMRIKKGTAPIPLISTTFYTANWSHPANVAQSSWISSGTVTASGAPSGGSTGRWVWLIRDVTNWYSDFQMNTFSFNSSYTDPSNTASALNAAFETHNHDAGFDNVDTDTQAERELAYTNKINNLDSFPFRQVVTASTNSVWVSDANGTPSSGTGASDGTNVYYVYYEASGSFTGGNNSFLRTEEMTYTGIPTISFRYIVVSSSTSAVGQVLLYWVVES